MTVATYGPRCYVHPDRVGSLKSRGPNRLIVLHTTEGSEGPLSAENLCAFMGLPGDRQTSSGSWYGASYQYAVDTDRVIPAVQDHYVAYSAAGANHDGVHVCIPGKVSQSRAMWLDTVSRAYIHNAAAVTVDLAAKHGIPLFRIYSNDVRIGEWGVCDHGDVSDAFGLSNHTDVGDNFPWDVFWEDVDRFTGQEANEMRARKEGPIRILDTRSNMTPGPLGAGEVRRIGVLPPSGGWAQHQWARAAVVDIGVADPQSAGFITAWSGVDPRPGTSTQDFEAGAERSNLAVVPMIGDDVNGWTFSVYSHVTTHLVIDLLGWAPVV